MLIYLILIQLEVLKRSRGEKQPLPGAVEIGTKIGKATVTNEKPPEIN